MVPLLRAGQIVRPDRDYDLVDDGFGVRFSRDIPKLVRLCQAGKLKFDGLVSRRYRLADINEAIADLKAGRVAGRCMVWMEEPPR